MKRLYNAELLTIGTEILQGEILNTNARFLSEKLAEIGVGVKWHTTIGDNPERIRQAFQTALQRADIVVTTGGLGPTADDITKECVCQVLGLELVEDALQMRRIEDFFRTRGIPMGETNRKQALVPQGSTVLYNPNGTAPGCWIVCGEKRAALLPGPPREMCAMFMEQLKPLLQPFSSGVILSHYVRTFGLGESRMAELAESYLDLQNPTVAPYANDGESYLRVTALAASAREAEDLCKPVIAKLRELLGEYVYAIDQTLEETLFRLLKKHGLTVGIAESCTGGGIAAKLTEFAGASAVFGLGVVAYSNDAKQTLLGVRPKTLADHGAVSPHCAAEMAQGIRKLAGSDIGLSVTGIAGPTGDGTNKPVGLIYLSVADGVDTQTMRCETGRGDRQYNRTIAVKQALHLLLQVVLRREEKEESKQ
ncbi:MAG: competence/damage-inducible protein A [Oscillospiraceae bacterium]|nr:competence/damage-inducible protein A [Oscillospiraceae bacterium]